MIKFFKTRNLYEVYCGKNVFSYAMSRFGKYTKSVAEISEKLCKRLNNYYEFTDDKCIIKIYSEKHGYIDVITDIYNFDLIKTYKWYIRKQHNTFYCESRIPNSTKRIKIHRLITNCPDGLVVDHINRNGLDNRDVNLRITDTSTNTKNCTVYNTNKVGFQGICILKNGSVSANWFDNGRPRRRYFGIEKYGLENAINLAIVARYENAINCGYVYNEEETEKYKVAKNKVQDIV